MLSEWSLREIQNTLIDVLCELSHMVVQEVLEVWVLLE